jgi:hypothetical protein
VVSLSNHERTCDTVSWRGEGQGKQRKALRAYSKRDAAPGVPRPFSHLSHGSPPLLLSDILLSSSFRFYRYSFFVHHHPYFTVIVTFAGLETAPSLSFTV